MINLKIVTPQKHVLSEDVDDVYLPGEEGEFGVLEMHTSAFAVLKAGEMRYTQDGQTTEMAIGSGIAEINQHQLTVLTNMAVRKDEIDVEAVLAAVESTKDALYRLSHDDDAEKISGLEAALARSMAKLALARKGQQ